MDTQFSSFSDEQNSTVAEENVPTNVFSSDKWRQPVDRSTSLLVSHSSLTVLSQTINYWNDEIRNGRQNDQIEDFGHCQKREVCFVDLMFCSTMNFHSLFVQPEFDETFHWFVDERKFVDHEIQVIVTEQNDDERRLNEHFYQSFANDRSQEEFPEGNQKIATGQTG